MDNNFLLLYEVNGKSSCMWFDSEDELIDYIVQIKIILSFEHKEDKLKIIKALEILQHRNIELNNYEL